jgi:hypothetical protein
MIILSSNTQVLQLISVAGANVAVVASFIDRSQTTGVVGIADRQITLISSATTSNIVAAPTASTTRNIKSLNICNANTEGQGNTTVTVQINSSGTLYQLYNTTLRAGDVLQFVEGEGFTSLMNYVPMDRTFVTQADQTISVTALTDITGLACDLTPAGFNPGIKYNFMVHLYHISAINTTGFRFGVNGPGTPDYLQVVAADPTDTASTPNTAITIAAGLATAYNTAVIAETTGADTVQMCIIAGSVVPANTATPGTPFTIQAAGEVAAAVTVKRGSWMRIWEAP